MSHYCEGCDRDTEHDGDGWCCGGDGLCAAREPEPSCCDRRGHKWTAAGTGGCDQNPGVWSLGGTTILCVTRCTRCGCRRCVTDYGAQRDPGQCDRWAYEVGAFLPDTGAKD